jgi:fumarylpyruvate hydrolase
MKYLFSPSPLVSVPVVDIVEQFPVHRVYCVGRNYEDHAREMGLHERADPFFFSKPADAVVVCPAEQTVEMTFPLATQNLHHEVELVLALNQGGSQWSLDEAEQAIYGYAVGIDFTRRDLQKLARDKGLPWDMAKAFDQSAPISPIVRRHCLENIANQAIQLHVNGELRQNSHIHQMIWSAAEVLVHLSKYVTLQAGDLVFTGTPAGVGAMQIGDRLHASISQVGQLHIKLV